MHTNIPHNHIRRSWPANSIVAILIIGLCLLLPLNATANGACQAAVAQPGKTVTGCLKVDGISRHYRLFVPSTYKQSSDEQPLLIGLHGGGGSPKAFERYSRFSKLSKSSGDFIVAYPQGLNKHWNDGRSDINETVDDLGFLEQLPRHLAGNVGLRLDSKRVYVAGMSNGALMALRIACEQPNWIAGVGVVAATMPKELLKACKPQKAVPIIFIFGQKDTAFLPDGRIVSPFKQKQLRGRHAGIKKSVAYWHTNNRCQAYTRPDKSINRYNKKWGPWKDDYTHIFIEKHTQCLAPVVWFDIYGGGHRWPDPTATNGRLLVKKLGLGQASHEIATAEILWAFFSTGQ